MRKLMLITFSIALDPVLSWLSARHFLLSPPSSSEQTHWNIFGKNNVATTEDVSSPVTEPNASDTFEEFLGFLQSMQHEIIAQIETTDGSGKTFSNDTWGVFDDSNEENVLSGGITRVMQGGNVIEKGACSLTLIRRGVLSAERAAAIRSRQDLDIQPGDVYHAAALSIVFHSRSPMVPTFRSDVRIFLVESEASQMAWFGGGADLTPYYLYDEDVKQFHSIYRDLCRDNPEEYSYENMKNACDDYFYLTARDEHRGTGGIFFDDLPATESYALPFVKSVAKAWMPSWLPIVEKRRGQRFSEKQKQWQLLRRGRYLEFNLLYDRGVKFGLANVNPRVEGVMVSAPPLIAWEYNHKIEQGSEEDRLMKILKSPVDWV